MKNPKELIEIFEKKLIKKKLIEFDYDKTKVASILGIHEQVLITKMNKYVIPLKKVFMPK